VLIFKILFLITKTDSCSFSDIPSAAYVLMTRKTCMAYTLVFRLLKKFCPGLNPDIIITDYEKAMRNALRRVFPNAALVGCYFHYSQVIYTIKIKIASNAN
jgi:hypothetical protein